MVDAGPDLVALAGPILEEPGELDGLRTVRRLFIPPSTRRPAVRTKRIELRRQCYPRHWDRSGTYLARSSGTSFGAPDEQDELLGQLGCRRTVVTTPDWRLQGWAVSTVNRGPT
jgi:hypothetical protein